MQLSEGDIETILNTLVFDGKAEMSLVADSSSGSSSNGQRKLFRVLRPLLPVTGLMRTPCGVCPVRNLSSCEQVSFDITLNYQEERTDHHIASLSNVFLILKCSDLLAPVAHAR